MGKKSIMADALSEFLNNDSHQTKHKFNYSTETMPYLYDIGELPESIFPTTFDLIDQHQRNGPYLI